MTKRKPMLFKELGNGCIVCTSHKLDRRGYLLIRDPCYKLAGIFGVNPKTAW